MTRQQEQQQQQQQQQQQEPPVPRQHAVRAVTAADDDEEDTYTRAIRTSGCMAQHEALQNCYIDTHDWRQCRDAMKEFKMCMAKRTAEQLKPPPPTSSSSSSSYSSSK
ncbi:hypothetical protein GQ42DRAFT_160002 [Ramicandelaber brevisporus]|nr:hypothetical protein GQ42DRAFT_160002 [Ramicandelaber brevisporus]